MRKARTFLFVKKTDKFWLFKSSKRESIRGYAILCFYILIDKGVNEMRRKKHKNKKKQELFEEIEKQELAEQETKQLNEEIEDPEFRSFFQDVLKKFPQKTSTAIMNAFATSKGKAEQLVTNSQTQLDKVFDEFLAGVSPDVKKKSHQTIHFAALSAAIIGFSPIPFSDAFLLVPVQLTMMSRLHKIFGQSWSESLGKSLTKELVVVSLGKSAVGNILKVIPVVGTVTGGMVNASVAVAITEALGWVTVKMLNDGVDIFDDVMSFKGQFSTLFKAIQNAKKK